MLWASLLGRRLGSWLCWSPVRLAIGIRPRSDARVRAAIIYRYAHQAMWDHPGCPTRAQIAAAAGVKESEIFVDPWGNSYVVECSRGSVFVGSLGPDGERGTRDDIWELHAPAQQDGGV